MSATINTKMYKTRDGNLTKSQEKLLGLKKVNLNTAKKGA